MAQTTIVDENNEKFECKKGNISTVDTIEKMYMTLTKAKLYALKLPNCIGFCVECDKIPIECKEYLIHFKQGNGTIYDIGKWFTYLSIQNEIKKQIEEKQEEVITSKKILMLCGDYGEDYEIMVPFQTLCAAGYEVDCICPEKKSGEQIQTSVHDFEGQQTYSEKRGHNFTLNYNFSDAVSNIKQYIGLLIPGGRAPEYLSIRKDVIDLVSYFTSNNLPIAAICHGPLILCSIDGYLQNKKATCYPACKPILDISGAIYQDASPITKCFTDGNLVTGAAWPAHPQFISQFMNILGAKINNNYQKNKILIICGDFVEDYEIMCVFQMLL
eukprot:365332_1